eukprot:7925957-Ditylum_brightwellii.AAC.2
MSVISHPSLIVDTSVFSSNTKIYCVLAKCIYADAIVLGGTDSNVGLLDYIGIVVHLPLETIPLKAF